MCLNFRRMHSVLAEMKAILFDKLNYNLEIQVNV